MLNMIKGCRIDNPSILFEGYEQTESGFIANVNAEKIQHLLEGFVLLHNECCFIIIEVPTNVKEETALSADGTRLLHKDVYYLDGLTPDKAIEFLRVFGEWFVHDGLSNFGIGLHSGANEIVLDKYNVVTVYTTTPRKYINFFESHNIHEVFNIKTAWDYFTHDKPGESFLYEYEGKNVYDMVEYLKRYGLYFAERREN